MNQTQFSISFKLTIKQSVLQHDFFIPYQHFQWRTTLLALEVVLVEAAMVEAVKDEASMNKAAFAIMQY